MTIYNDLTVVVSVGDQIRVRWEIELAPYRFHTYRIDSYLFPKYLDSNTQLQLLHNAFLARELEGSATVMNRGDCYNETVTKESLPRKIASRDSVT
jgi:hypothetical protein